MYHVTVGGENAGVSVKTLGEAKAWVEKHNPNWDCVVWLNTGSIAAVYRRQQWS